MLQTNDIATAADAIATTERIAVQATRAAYMMDVTRKTLARWEKKGFVRSTKVGGVKFYDVAELRKLVAHGQPNS